MKEKGITSYKTKVVKHWEAISMIYSKDHANGERKTGAKIVAEPEEERIETSPEIAPKRQQIGDHYHKIKHH